MLVKRGIFGEEIVNGKHEVFKTNARVVRVKKKKEEKPGRKKKKARKKKIIFFNKFLFRFLYYYTNAKYNKPFVTYIQIKKIYITKKN